MHEPGGLLGGCFGDAEDALDDGGLGGYPAETTARCYSLGEGVEADNASIVVEVQVGGDEGVEEWEAGFLGKFVNWRSCGRRHVAGLGFKTSCGWEL